MLPTHPAPRGIAVDTLSDRAPSGCEPGCTCLPTCARTSFVLALSAAMAEALGVACAGIHYPEISAPVTASALTDGDSQLVIGELGSRTQRTHRRVALRGPVVVAAAGDPGEVADRHQLTINH